MSARILEPDRWDRPFERERRGSETSSDYRVIFESDYSILGDWELVYRVRKARAWVYNHANQYYLYRAELARVMHVDPDHPVDFDFRSDPEEYQGFPHAFFDARLFRKYMLDDLVIANALLREMVSRSIHRLFKWLAADLIFILYLHYVFAHFNIPFTVEFWSLLVIGSLIFIPVALYRLFWAIVAAFSLFPVWHLRHKLIYDTMRWPDHLTIWGDSWSLNLLDYMGLTLTRRREPDILEDFLERMLGVEAFRRARRMEGLGRSGQPEEEEEEEEEENDLEAGFRWLEPTPQIWPFLEGSTAGPPGAQLFRRGEERLVPYVPPMGPGTSWSEPFFRYICRNPLRPSPRDERLVIHPAQF